MKKETKEKLIAGVGAGVVSSLAKEPFSNEELGGYSKKVENVLSPIKISDKVKLNYHIGGLTKKVPLSILTSLASYGVYDALKGKQDGKKKPLIKKLMPSLVAGATAATVTYPLANATQKFPKEISRSALTEGAKSLLRAKSRLGQSLIAAPVSMISYDLLNNDSKSKTRNIASGVLAGALGSASISYNQAKYEALRPEVETAAKGIGDRLAKGSKFFSKELKSGITRGHMTGRMVKVLQSKIPAGILGFGTGMAAYNIIKNHLQKDKK